MVGLLGIHLGENLSGFELARVGLVLEVDRFIERQGVKDCCFGIVRISEIKPLQRFFIGQDACAMIELVGVFVKKLDGIYIVPLALRLGADRFGSFNGGQAAL